MRIANEWRLAHDGISGAIGRAEQEQESKEIEKSVLADVSNLLRTIPLCVTNSSQAIA